MAEELATPSWVPLAPADLPPSLLAAEGDHVALSERPDPLDCGFVLAGGVLAPLPPRVRLPHEADEQDGDELDADEVPA